MNKKEPNKLIYQDKLITKFLIESPEYGDYEVTVDTEDYTKIKDYKWRMSIYKETAKYKYICTNTFIKNKKITLMLHNLIMDDTQIQHKDKNIFNNRKQNLYKLLYNKLVYQDSIITKFLIDSPKHGNHEVIIDTEDYEKIKDYRWNIQFNKKRNKFTAVFMSLKKNKNKTTMGLHQLIMSDVWIDHKNGNIFDNRKENLRKCTNSENQMNASISKRNTSGYKGVSWDKNLNKWRVCIKIKESVVTLGYFVSKIEAAEIYNKKAHETFGEFARLNIIEEDK